MKDWTGNKKSAYATLGASNHSEIEREIDDYYATDPKALEVFLDKIEEDGIKLHNNIWECACGEGHLSKVLESRGYKVWSTDLVDRGYGSGNFVEKALEVTRIGTYTVMFLKIQFLEGQRRRELFKRYPPKYVYVNSTRQICYINGDMSRKMSSASCYCWFVWQKGFDGEPVIRWI